jgi:hypothetical protein
MAILPQSRQERDVFVSERSKLLKYDGKTLGQLSVDGMTVSEIITKCSAVVNAVRLFKYEAKLCLIFQGFGPGTL